MLCWHSLRRVVALHVVGESRSGTSLHHRREVIAVERHLYVEIAEAHRTLIEGKIHSRHKTHRVQFEVEPLHQSVLTPTRVNAVVNDMGRRIAPLIGYCRSLHYILVWIERHRQVYILACLALHLSAFASAQTLDRDGVTSVSKGNREMQNDTLTLHLHFRLNGIAVNGIMVHV